MALQQLNDEQIKTWSRAQKDEWWLKNIYRGDMPQLTLRSALTGFLLGGILAATNLYIGGKTGITTGVGLTSVILAFAFYRILAQSGLAKDFTILENNCTQSIATAAGYMTSPLISALAAYMMEKLVPHGIFWRGWWWYRFWGSCWPFRSSAVLLMMNSCPFRKAGRRAWCSTRSITARAMQEC